MSDITETNRTTAPGTTSDPTYPALHVRSPRGWVNDPNGPIRWNGRYHLFFQHNPGGPVHGDIHWGHASSDDLAAWQNHAVALAPVPGGPDSAGCWSGCAVDDNGVATAVYTGVADDTGVGTVCVAYAQDDDLQRWHQNPVPVGHPPAGTALIGFRDPFVFRHGGSRYGVVGAGLPGGGAPQLYLYGCDDLHDWRYLGVLLDAEDPVAAEVAAADIWECPQLARLGDRWVLIVSLWTGDRLGRVVYLVGDLVAAGDVASHVGAGLRFVPTHGGLTDAGHDFYAPAVLAEEDRALLWGWSWEDRPDADVLRAGWAGALTLARELSLSKAGRLVSRPVDAVDRLRTGAPNRHLLTAAAGPEPAVELHPGSFDVLVTLTSDWVAHVPPDGSSRVAPVVLTLNADGPSLRLVVDGARNEVSLQRETVEPTRQGWSTTAPLADGGLDESAGPGDGPGPGVVRGPVAVRVIVDGSLVEIYVADGPVFTERLYPAGAGWRLSLGGPVGSTAEVIAWQLARPSSA